MDAAFASSSSQASGSIPSSTFSSMSLNTPCDFHNPIDLTLDDNDEPAPKRLRKELPFDPQSMSPFAPAASTSAQPLSTLSSGAYLPPFALSQPNTISFGRPSMGVNPQPQAMQSHFRHSASDAYMTPRIQTQAPAERQVIDLTSSRTPSPTQFSRPPATPSMQPALNLPPKAPVCIGQLMVTALVLYPVPYLCSNTPATEAEWGSVQLMYEHTPNRAESETIHIRAPQDKDNAREPNVADAFGVVEQKVASTLGPMLAKGLIKLEGRVRRGMPNLPILPLQILIFTPYGNTSAVGKYLRDRGLLLDHPTLPFDSSRYPYCNPHNPPPGGHNKTIMATNKVSYPASRWSGPAVSGKSVEVQRSQQVDQLFRSVRNGQNLPETEPTSDVATTLYPHQKKALTFLLQREREKTDADGKYPSLWESCLDPVTGQQRWTHLVADRECDEEPDESKGAILADDMGLGKTITCVSLIAATLRSAQEFVSQPLDQKPEHPNVARNAAQLDADHFSGRVWGMPDPSQQSNSAKAQAKAAREQEKREQEYARACRIKARSRATLIICPLSTVANWEDQFREHWQGDVSVVGGNCPAPPTPCQMPVTPGASTQTVVVSHKQGTPLRVYIYHGNARRPDPAFLADFDAVITTYATLASEYSKQTRSTKVEDDEDDGASSDYAGGVDVDASGNPILRLPKPKAGRPAGLKRKKSCLDVNGVKPPEASSALQSVHWFRVVLDEAHSIKETQTVASRASCDLVADRRLCLTGTPVQNKLDDVYALIKFLRLTPFDDKSVWTEYIGGPVKYNHSLGIERLQTIMQTITLRRTKETKTPDGKFILSLPPRKDEIRLLKFDEQERAVYDRFYNESKAQFNEMTDKNEVMKNYVGILQKILRLRQICDHFELVDGKSPDGTSQSADGASYDDVVAAIASEGINAQRAAAVFAILRESATTQCVECGYDLCSTSEAFKEDTVDGTSTPKRGKKPKAPASRASTRQSSPAAPRAVLTRCQHLFCLECYRVSIYPGWPDVPSPDMRQSCTACQTELLPSDAVEVKPDLQNPDTTKKKQVKKEKRQKGITIENFHPSTKIQALLGDLIVLSKANPYSANYDPPPDEIQMFDGNGKNIGISKSVVFSQWTTMLDKIEDALEMANIRYDRLDGTMKRDDRSRAMDALKNDPGCEVLLVSLKAGGVGLNLTAAQRVYLMDPYWNPAVENQAVDRIHRLGQTRPVTTVKLIIDGSIEARLLEVQRKKTELANMTLGQPSLTKHEVLARRIEELNQLFKRDETHI